MEQLEADLRNKIIKALKIFVWVCITLDIAFFIGFYLTDTLKTSVPAYILKYLCLPFSVNMTTFLIAKHINKSEKYTDNFKNMICSFALCTLGGSMGIFHSYYTPLWCAPCMALLFCSVFHNKKLHRIMLIYCCILTIIATIYISLERPSQTFFYIQHCIVVLGLTLLSSVVANEVQKYQFRVQTLTTTSIKNEKKYRKRLETDHLTKVHSREYMQEVVNRTFDIPESTDPVGIAILDLDNFKQINDKYGHDNGDKVLCTLGKLLNDHASDKMKVGRFGGEEFIIIFQGSPQEEYAQKIDELRKQFSACSFDFMKNNVSFSAGIVACTSQISYEKAFHLADQALYHSKKAGKNQITFEWLD